LYNDKTQIDKYVWLAGKTLAKDLNTKIKELLTKNSLAVNNIDAYCAYLGPGSFTGLRIGISSINALAYINDKPIVGSSSDDWQGVCIARLSIGENDKVLLPLYGGEAHITAPKK
jgi:tRNA threonylcarbamoyladenosine biosynthesis protein TsaB